MAFSFASSRSEKLVGNEFLIEGRLSGVDDGMAIRLYRKNVVGELHIAFDTVKNGRFKFTGEATTNPEQLIFYSFEEGALPMGATVWIEPKAKVKIKGKGKFHLLWEVKSSVPYQKEENRYQNKSRDIIAEMARIHIMRYDLIKKRSAASSENEALAYTKVADSLVAIVPSLHLKRFLANISIMENTNITPVWLNKMEEFTSSFQNPNFFPELREKALELYDRMSEENKNTPTGYKITTFLFPPIVVEVGDDIADGYFFDVNGNTKQISDYSDSDKYLLLDFWFRYCGACILAFPTIKEISETYRDNLTIISVSIDSDANWKVAMTENDMPWVNIRDPKGSGGLAAGYDVRGYPTYIIISPEGKVVDKWSGWYGEESLKRKVSENIK